MERKIKKKIENGYQKLNKKKILRKKGYSIKTIDNGMFLSERRM
jgi:hypothetical protein